MRPVNATGHAAPGEQAWPTGHDRRSARKSAQKQPGGVPPIANWAVKRQLGLGHAKIEPDPSHTGEDSRDDSRAGQWSGAAGGARSDQGDDHPDVREGRHRGVKAAAGVDRLLGAMVRPVPPAHADSGEGGPRRKGQGQAGEDEHRRASGYPGPDGYPVDPGRDRLRQRPARRRFHGRGAGEPGQRFHQQGVGRHAGRWRAECRGNSQGGRSGSGGRRSRHISANLCRGAGGGPDQYRSAGGAYQMLRCNRGHRASQADAGHGAGIEAQ